MVPNWGYPVDLECAVDVWHAQIRGIVGRGKLGVQHPRKWVGADMAEGQQCLRSLSVAATRPMMKALQCSLSMKLVHCQCLVGQVTVMEEEDVSFARIVFSEGLKIQQKADVPVLDVLEDHQAPRAKWMCLKSFHELSSVNSRVRYLTRP